MARLRLYGPKGSSEVRRDRSVVDATDWTPDNLSAGETIGGLVADDVTLAAREWQDVRIVADFHGSPLGSESVEVEPLIAVPDPNGGVRKWSTLPKFTLTPNLDGELAPVGGHDCAFRITALALDGATDVSLLATGGRIIQEDGRI